MAINLLPQALAEVRRISRTRRLVFLGALAFVILAVVISGGGFLYKTYLKGRVTKLGADLRKAESKLESFSDFAQELAGLEQRVSILETHFEATPQYSVLMDRVLADMSGDINVVDLSLVSSEELSFSGTTKSYLSLSSFLSKLVKPQNGQQIFESAVLRSLSSNKELDGATFVVVLKPNKEALLP